MKKKQGRPRTRVQRTAVSFKLPAGTYDQLVAHCKDNGTTQTWIVWKALDEYLNQRKKAGPE